MSQVCERKKLGLRVLYQNAVVFWYDPPGKRESTQILAYHIHSDHAFFYDDPDAMRGAAQLPKGPLKLAVNPRPDQWKLRIKGREDDEIPWKDLRPFNIDLLKCELQRNAQTHWRCYRSELEDVMTALNEHGIRTGLGWETDQMLSQP